MLHQLQHKVAAHSLQGDVSRATVAIQELEFRGKGLRWIKNFRTNIAKEITALIQEEGQGSKHQDQEMMRIIESQEKDATSKENE